MWQRRAPVHGGFRPHRAHELGRAVFGAACAARRDRRHSHVFSRGLAHVLQHVALHCRMLYFMLHQVACAATHMQPDWSRSSSPGADVTAGEPSPGADAAVAGTAQGADGRVQQRWSAFCMLQATRCTSFVLPPRPQAYAVRCMRRCILHALHVARCTLHAACRQLAVAAPALLRREVVATRAQAALRSHVAVAAGLQCARIVASCRRCALQRACTSERRDGGRKRGTRVLTAGGRGY